MGPTSAPRSDSDMRARRRERSRKEAEKEEANRRAAKVRAEQMRLKEEQKTQEERKNPAGGGKSDAASRRARVPAESSKAVWTLLAEVVFLVHTWQLKRTWRTWRPMCGGPHDEVRDAPYQLYWLVIAVPSLLIACVAAVQPRVTDNLRFLRPLPFFGPRIASISDLRRWLSSTCGD